MTTALKQIQDEVSRLKLDDSLLVLNHLLAVSRGMTTDPEIERYFQSRQVRPPAFPIHFLAKQILLHATNFGRYPLSLPRFQSLLDLYFELDDPIVGDPNWKHSDPTGCFVRILTQQIPSQRRNMIQKYGLALGLFRDTGRITRPFNYDLREDIETELGITIEQFMTMGHLCYALSIASVGPYKCFGTFTPMTLADAFAQGMRVSVPEVWNRFLPRVACDRDTFRDVSNRASYRAKDAHYTQFEFNPLHRFPVIDVGDGRYVAVDPDLIVERTTFGLFYDLFERHGTNFAHKFGYVFDQFIGKLLRSACPVESIWSASEWEASHSGPTPTTAGKIGDWAYGGHSHNVLIECKSLRPSLELTTYGSDNTVQAVIDRISSALEQLVGHNDSIQQGKWREQGLLPKPTACVVVTYGQIQTVNGPFVRKRVEQHLTAKGLSVPPFVVLSLEECDVVIRLVELGYSLDEVILALPHEENSFDPLQKYQSELTTLALSSYTYNMGKEFMERTVAPHNEKG